MIHMWENGLDRFLDEVLSVEDSVNCDVHDYFFFRMATR